MPGFGEYVRKSEKGKGVNRANLPAAWGKKAEKSKTHFEVRNFAHFQKAIKKLKSADEITIRYPIAERGG